MLDQQLENWQAWGLPCTPTVLRELLAGRSNRSYLLACGEQRWVLRLNTLASDALGINREREARVLALAADAGIAPRVLYNNPQQGVLLSEYIETELWPASAPSSSQRDALLALLQRVHKLSPDLPRYDYLAHGEAYWQRLQALPGGIDAGLCEARQQILPALASFQSACCCNALCHHDLVKSNVLNSRRGLYLIDWEYAGRGCRAYDYAALAAEWSIDSGELPGSGVALSCSLSQASDIYAYLCALWQALRNRLAD